MWLSLEIVNWVQGVIQLGTGQNATGDVAKCVLLRPQGGKR